MNKRHTTGITQRFLQICAEVMNDKMCTKKEFAESIGEYQQNLSLMDKGKRAPTLDQIVNACLKYGYSANWIMLNQGAKKTIKDAAANDAITLEQRINNLETEVAKLTRNMKRIKPVTPNNHHRNHLNGKILRQGTKKGTLARSK